jgi:hypothetical protein
MNPEVKPRPHNPSVGLLSAQGKEFFGLHGISLRGLLNLDLMVSEVHLIFRNAAADTA